jgi:hypothetical protein
MCNAYGHRSNCTCGFGGTGHLGRRSGGIQPARQGRSLGTAPERRLVKPTRMSIWSVTKPNSKCPVCGASVFYYQNDAGSSVFFDELGPPWPKHPCTDSAGENRMRSSTPSTSSTAISGSRAHVDSGVPTHVWRREGWFLVEHANVFKLSNAAWCMTGTYGPSGARLRLHMVVPSGITHDVGMELAASKLIYFRRVGGTSAEVAFLDSSLEAKRILAIDTGSVSRASGSTRVVGKNTSPDVIQIRRPEESADGTPIQSSGVEVPPYPRNRRWTHRPIAKAKTSKQGRKQLSLDRRPNSFDGPKSGNAVVSDTVLSKLEQKGFKVKR